MEEFIKKKPTVRQIPICLTDLSSCPSWQLLFSFFFWYAILIKTAKEGSTMANYGKYYIAVRLLLLKQYLEANAGRTRISDLFSR